jgi:hypothetical protein
VRSPQRLIDFPAARTIQPVYVEPVTIGRKSGAITVGDG